MKSLEKFTKIVWDFYESHGRGELPWRKTDNPYHIAVSEIMLQQTQVDRVIPKYEAFIRKFPTVKKLSAAPLSEVLVFWSGLGYNRRAKFLHEMAKAVVMQGEFPHSYDELKTLPGIGPYTAGAIAAFAYNTPISIIETNIRTVFMHHFFAGEQNISDKDILDLVQKTLDRKNAREWYWALMDYGSHLKKQGSRIHRKAKSYVKQSTFQGSRRQIRGAIMRELLKQPATVLQLSKRIGKSTEELQSVLDDLLKEKLLRKEKSTYII